MRRVLLIVTCSLLLTGCGDNQVGFQWDPSITADSQVDSQKIQQDFVASITRNGWILPLMDSYTVSGSFSAAKIGDEYRLEAVLDPVPNLEADHRLRTWLVLEDPYEFIETGPLVEENGKLIDRFTTNADVTRFKRYEITAYHEKYGELDHGYPIAIRLFEWQQAPQ